MQTQQNKTKSPAPTRITEHAKFFPTPTLTERGSYSTSAEIIINLRLPQHDQPVEIEISNPVEKISIDILDVDYIILHLQKFKELCALY